MTDPTYVKSLVNQIQQLKTKSEALKEASQEHKARASTGKDLLCHVMADINQSSLALKGNVVKNVKAHHHRKITKSTIREGLQNVLGEQAAAEVMRQAEQLAQAEDAAQPSEDVPNIRCTKIGEMRAKKSSKSKTPSA